MYRAAGGSSSALLATFTYDPSGIPESVVVGTDPVNGPRYYYVYNGHGDVVALTDASGTVVASYSYDVWGNLTASSETIPNANGWTNPYRYDGKDGARYDGETGLYWLSTRAYDPTLGRFLQRDPLGRAPLFFWDQPYAYAGNNPLVNTDPSGELVMGMGGGERVTAAQEMRVVQGTRRLTRIAARHPAPVKQRSCDSRGAHPTCQQIDSAKQIAAETASQLFNAAVNLPLLKLLLGSLGSGPLRAFLNWVAPWWIPAALVAAAKALVTIVIGILLAVMAEMLVAAVLFEVQSLAPDGFWESAGSFSTMEGEIDIDIGALGFEISALGVAIFALTSDPFTIALGVGLFVGGLVGLIPVFRIALNGLTREQQALGY